MPNTNESVVKKINFEDVKFAANRALDKLTYYLSDLETLEIVTAVGNATEFKVFSREGVDAVKDSDKAFYDVQKQFRTELKAKADKVAYTRLHVLSADIATVFHEAFMGDDFKFLREYHLEQTKNSHGMMLQNINAVGELITLFARREEKE